MAVFLIAIVTFGCLVSLAFFFLFRRNRKALVRPAAEEWKATSAQAEWQGIRYRNDGAQPVILVHGYAGNTRNWRDLGYALHGSGFDIWMANLRGHGQGAHRSSAKGGEGCYSFDALAAEDFTEIVNHVVSVTGKKVSLIAHSMGGVAARAYLAGVRRDSNGEFKVDSDRAKLIAGEKVVSCVLMGSPPHFKNCSTAVRLLMKTPGPLVELFHSGLPVADTAPTVPDAPKTFGKFRDSAFSKLVGGLTANSVVRNIVHVTNFDPLTMELPRLLQKGVSKVHVDLVRDIQRWMNHGDIHSRNGFDFSRARPIFVPMFFIAGEYDGLAHWEDVMAAADQHAASSPTWKLLVRRTSHVDLIAGERAARLVAPPIAKFLANPFSLGSPGTRLEL